MVVIIVSGVILIRVADSKSSEAALSTMALTSNTIIRLNHAGLLSSSASLSAPVNPVTWAVADQAGLNLTFSRFNKLAVLTFTSWAFVGPKNLEIGFTISVHSSLMDIVVYNPDDNLGTGSINVPISV